MYKDVLQNIENVSVWPVISFVIFFLFFLVLLWWVFKADKKQIDYLRRLPMDDGIQENSGTNFKHESL